MDKKYKIFAGPLAILVAVAAVAVYLHGHQPVLLNPAGPIARQERNLMYALLLLSLIIVIPVFSLLFVIAWKYRETNHAAKYAPDWDHSRLMEAIWWGVPTILIGIVAVVTWNSSHVLDPSRPLVSAQPPITIQVVALQWRWLFIYPEQRIATVNAIHFPTNTPLDFEITADAPMNSFWIPQLGGQIYAMPGMSTQLHLLASKPGSFRGSSANISGSGFAGMKFTATASSQLGFEHWVNSVKQSKQNLDQTRYNRLAKPNTHSAVAYYSAVDPALYDRIVIKYMPLGAVQ